jgi:SAM-dependent methyltransferase
MTLARAGEWDTSQGRVTYRLDGAVVFDDTEDHWRQAVCRLLKLDAPDARRWTESVAAAANERFGCNWPQCSTEQKLDALSVSARDFWGHSDHRAAMDLGSVSGIDILGEQADCVWVQGIRADSALAVVGSRRLGHGVLVQTTADGWDRVAPALYEESYFEGRSPGIGYGDYLAQGDWRMQKSQRQVRQIQGLALYLGRPLGSGTRLLDVGSGYGYFRKAAEACGWTHCGLDVSRHAARVARDQFGYHTFVCDLESLLSQSATRYDLITLFDCIEHVPNPIALVHHVSELLLPEGLCVIRTPNLQALERDVFGPYYHSVRREHLHYFSPVSLCQTYRAAELSPVHLSTDSHLLQGFLGQQLDSYARILKGSDLLAIGRKAAEGTR